MTADVRRLPPRVLTNVRHRDPAAAGLPQRPNTWAPLGEDLALWLGPDEWLVRGPAWTSAAGRAAELRWRAAAAAAVDVSAQWTALRVAGPAAADTLAAACSLDLHPSVFGVGRCAQTLVARVPVILVRLDDRGYELLVRPSLAAHLGAFLDDAD